MRTSGWGWRREITVPWQVPGWKLLLGPLFSAIHLSAPTWPWGCYWGLPSNPLLLSVLLQPRSLGSVDLRVWTNSLVGSGDGDYLPPGPSGPLCVSPVLGSLFPGLHWRSSCMLSQHSPRIQLKCGFIFAPILPLKCMQWGPFLAWGWDLCLRQGP